MLGWPHCHKSHKSMELVKNKNIKEFDWPIQSPGISPIKHIWVGFNKE